MPLYFYLLDRHTFHERLCPALSASWRTRSFAAIRVLCDFLAPALRDFQRRFHVAAEEMLLPMVAGTLSFDRGAWRLLVGEVLMVSAVEVPELETAPDTLAWLLDRRPPAASRRDFSPIQQAHLGSRDLTFGPAYYRPEHAGWNDREDVRRLAAYLASVDPRRWTIADLADMLTDDDARAEELDYVRDWFPVLVELYQRAEARDQVVVCEML